MAKRKTKTDPDSGTYILWAPGSNFPPRKTWTSRKAAEEVAAICAPKYSNTVYVAKLVTVSEPPRPVFTPTTTTKLD